MTAYYEIVSLDNEPLRYSGLDDQGDNYPIGTHWRVLLVWQLIVGLPVPSRPLPHPSETLGNTPAKLPWIRGPYSSLLIACHLPHPSALVFSSSQQQTLPQFLFSIWIDIIFINAASPGFHIFLYFTSACYCKTKGRQAISLLVQS